MTKVLHLVGIMNRAGLETFIMNMYRVIDRENFSFDFLCMCDGEGDYDSEIASLGGIINHVKMSSRKGIARHVSNYFILLDAFKNYSKEYDIIHIHNYHAFDSLISAHAAIKGGFNKVIVHSHSTSAEFHRNLHYLARFFLNRENIIKMACSYEAGKWMFGNNMCLVIKNGINTSLYKYNEVARKRIRNEIGITNELVIGNVARFEPVKNHEFLLPLAKELKSAGLIFKIVLVGDGVKRQEVETEVNEQELSDCFIFAGLRNNVNEFYQAFDLFVMPSIFEGIPFSVIEAQTAGLPCLLSKGIPSDVDFSENVVHASINNVVEWKNNIIKMMEKKVDRYAGESIIKENGFDIKENCFELEKTYESLMR